MNKLAVKRGPGFRSAAGIFNEGVNDLVYGPAMVRVDNKEKTRKQEEFNANT